MPEEKVYPFPVWGTQGGGLAEKRGDQFFFVEAPEGLSVGDKVPDEWGLVPALNLGSPDPDDDDWDMV